MVRGGYLLPCILLQTLKTAEGVKTFRIGVLYEKAETHVPVLIRAAHTFIKDNHIVDDNQIEVTFVYRELFEETDIHAISRACSILAENIVILIGPGTSALVDIIAPLFQHYNIPVITPTATASSLEKHTNLFKLVPTDMQHSYAIASVISYLHWSKLNILASADAYGASRLQSLTQSASKLNWVVHSMQMFSVNITNFSQMLLTIKESGARVTVLIASAEQTRKILKVAKERSMMGSGWTWILSDEASDDHFFNGSNLVPPHLCGLIGATVGNMKGEVSINFLKFLEEKLYMTSSSQASSYTTPNEPNLYINKAKSFLKWADAVVVAIDGLNRAASYISPPDKLTCSSNNTWTDGQILLSSLRETDIASISQEIRFNRKQFPTSWAYSIVNSRMTGWTKVASWQPTTGLMLETEEKIILANNLTYAADFVTSLSGLHVNVVTVLEPPFFMMVNGTPPKDCMDIQPDEMEGFGIDFLVKMSKLLNFTYRLYLVPDENWGARIPVTGQWNGMVQQLILKEADFAYAIFSITKVREAAIDFSLPYIDLGFRIVTQKTRQKADLFEFLKPFSPKMWAVLGITLLAIAIFIVLVEKLSPEGCHGSFIYAFHDLDAANETRATLKAFRREKAEAFGFMTMSNSFWFCISFLLQQGYESYPHSQSAKALVSIYSMIIMILVATYMAQLGALLIRQRLQGKVNSAADLYNQNEIRYGTNGNNSIQQFFCDSEIDLYSNMCKKMYEWSSFTRDTAEAIDKLYAGNFAYISDSVVTDGMTEREPCVLRKVGDIFSKQGFGVGMQKGSSYRSAISEAILQLRKQGFMAQLDYKWYTLKSECREENRVLTETEKNQKGFSDLRGVFMSMLFLVGLSPVILVVEMIMSCFETRQKRMRMNGTTSLTSAIVYQFKRMGRDFCLYYVPERLKREMGLTDYLWQNEADAWEAKMASLALAREA